MRGGGVRVGTLNGQPGGRFVGVEDAVPAEKPGGTIGAESIYGGGSTFWFILPVDGPIRQPG